MLKKKLWDKLLAWAVHSSLVFIFLPSQTTFSGFLFSTGVWHITGVHKFSSNKNSDTIFAHMVAVYASIILGCSRWREVTPPLGSVWTQGQGVTATFSLLGCWVQHNVPDTFEMLFHDQFLGAWCINVYFSHYLDHALIVRVFNVTSNKTNSD